MESWLLLRSLRTYKLRVLAQTESAEKIVKYLSDNRSQLSKLTKIYHASLQKDDFVKAQLPIGGPPTFSIEVVNEQVARELPSKLKYFHHATSLGGVESLVEWRAMSDPKVPETLLRLSIGLEDTEDLIRDLHVALV
jgi:cystathionine gamma-synthase